MSSTVIYNYSRSRTTADTDPAARFIYKDGTTYPYSVNYDGTNLVLIAGGVTTTLARATYTTNLSMLAAVRAVTGWEGSIIVGKGAALTAGWLSTGGAVTSGGEAGVTVYYDTSAFFYRSMTLGVEEVQTLLCQAARQDGNLPWLRDPVEQNATAGDGGLTWNEPYQAKALFAQARATAAGTIVWIVTIADQFADKQTLQFAGGSTGVANTCAGLSVALSNITSNPGQRIVFEYGDGANDPTSAFITVEGAITAAGSTQTV